MAKRAFTCRAEMPPQFEWIYTVTIHRASRNLQELDRDLEIATSYLNAPRGLLLPLIAQRLGMIPLGALLVTGALLALSLLDLLRLWILALCGWEPAGWTLWTGLSLMAGLGLAVSLCMNLYGFISYEGSAQAIPRVLGVAGWRCSHGLVHGGSLSRCPACRFVVLRWRDELSRQRREAESRLQFAKQVDRAGIADSNSREAHKVRRELFCEFMDLRSLRSINAYEFEKIVAKLFRSLLYEARTTPKSGDGGVDVIARGKGETLAIQCKNYAETTKVGGPEIQQLAGAGQSMSASRCVMVTTSSCTPAARTAAEKLGVELVEHELLLTLLRTHSLIRQFHPSGLSKSGNT